MLQPTQVLYTRAPYGTPTTRRHPRTLNEAFPRTEEYANPITHYKSSTNGLIVRLLSYGVFYCWIGMAVYMVAKQYKMI